jgi:hypothetical protein
LTSVTVQRSILAPIRQTEPRLLLRRASRTEQKGETMRRIARISMWALFVFSYSVAGTYALTPEQCSYFSRDGKTAICHASASAKGPYVNLEISAEACIQGHTGHPSDYIAVGDPTCQGQGCLPSGAPCDGTLGCCEGLVCTNGACTATDAYATPSTQAEMVCEDRTPGATEASLELARRP